MKTTPETPRRIHPVCIRVRMLRLACWVVTGAAVLTMLVFVGSRWVGAGITLNDRLRVHVIGGGLSASSITTGPAGSVWFGRGEAWMWDASPFYRDFGGDYTLVVPLWIPLLAFMLCGGFLWWIDATMGRRARRIADGLCGFCGYDRSGLSNETACPECGHQ